MAVMKRIIGGIVSSALMAVAFTSIGPPLLSSYLDAKHQRDLAFQTQRSSDEQYIAEHYKTLCPAYWNASYFGKLVTYRNRAYCADFQNNS